MFYRPYPVGPGSFDNIFQEAKYPFNIISTMPNIYTGAFSAEIVADRYPLTLFFVLYIYIYIYIYLNGQLTFIIIGML